MLKFLVASVLCGILFAVLDTFLNGNPLAARLFEAYKPVARKKLNLAAGILIDLAYGFLIAGAFLLLRASLPGEVGIVKGLSLALCIWTFRVLMGGLSQWMTFEIGPKVLLYSLAVGLVEMAALGALVGAIIGT
jgi:hypothetical protein